MDREVMSEEVTDESGLSVEALLEQMIQHEASDLHLAPNQKPLFRIEGALKFIDPFSVQLSSAQVEKLAEELVGKPAEEVLAESGSFDGATTSKSNGRFRYNIYKRMPGCSIALRQLASRFRTLEELGLPETLSNWCQLVDGLVLICGPTGSGKSTTLATLVNQINLERADHIITIEDPIEYLHDSIRGRVDQVQIGIHAPDFKTALVASLRQDPDVILVGEIRERETIRTAITAAETGHLVFATVHAPDCAGAIQRIVSVFPADEQSGILRQLSMNLRGVLSQRLVPADGPVLKQTKEKRVRRARVLLSEILQNTPATANLIAKGQFKNLYSFIETGAKHNMQTLDQSLINWIKTGHLLKSTAIAYSRNPSTLEKRIERSLAKDTSIIQRTKVMTD